MSIQKHYNYCLDFIKGIACIFVVFMHCEFPGLFGIAVQAISRFCVPLFFMVSGFYCYKEFTITMLERRNKVIHILEITVNASLFYILFALVQSWIWGDVSLTVSFGKIIVFVCCNQMFIIVSQMWFLFALLYVYVVYMVVGGTDWFRQHCLKIAWTCIILYVCLAQGCHIIGLSVPNFIYKNWLIEGLGFFTLGYVIHKYQKSLSYNNSTLLSIVALFTVLSLIERFLLGRDFGVNICSIPQVTALFIYALNNPKSHKGYIQRLGKTCSMFIYILHPFVWHSLERVYNVVHINGNIVALYLMPLAVLLLTILLSVFCYRFQNKMKTQLS